MNDLINQFAKVSNDLEKLARECAELTKKLHLESIKLGVYSEEEEADENEIAVEFLDATNVRYIVEDNDITTQVDYTTSDKGVEISVEAQISQPSDLVETVVSKFIRWQREQRKGGKNVL